jgi:hypothetical protein
MEKLVILLITAGVGLTAERSSKQLFYSHNPYLQQQPAPAGVNTLPHQSNNFGSLVPYSNIYPFYSLWNNFAAASGSPWVVNNSPVASNQVPRIPYAPQGGQTYGNGHNALSQVPSNNPYTGTAAHQYYQVPMNPNYGIHQNLWNFGSNQIKSVAAGISNPINRNDVVWDLPLKSYDDIRNDAAAIVIKAHHEGNTHEENYQNDAQSFQRGQVESFPSNGNAPLTHHSQQGFNNPTVFTRGHVESKPGFSNDVLAN